MRQIDTVGSLFQFHSYPIDANRLISRGFAWVRSLHVAGLQFPMAVKADNPGVVFRWDSLQKDGQEVGVV